MRRRGEPKHWTVTYVGDDGEYWETQDSSCWRAAVLEAMKEVGVYRGPQRWDFDD